MTEVVQKRLELMTEELEEMRRTKLFTIDETRIILTKRKEFEHKIHSVSKDVKHFTDYISYEKCLLKDIRLRRNKYKVGEKKRSIEHNIIKRIKWLYDTSLNRFSNDIPLFLSFLKFCKKVSYINAASDAVSNMIKSQSHNPQIWHVAASWHAYDRKDTNQAMIMLLKGVAIHKDSQMLYKEMVQIGIFDAERITVDDTTQQQDTSIKKLEKVVASIFENVKDSNFYIELLALLEKYSFTVQIQEMICEHLMKDYSDDVNVWHILAQRERKDICHNSNTERNTNTDADKTDSAGSTAPKRRTPKARLEACFAKYRQGLATVPQSHRPKLWSLYLDFLLKLQRESHGAGTVLKLETLKAALNEAFLEGHLSEMHYMAWLELVDDKDGLEIAEKGTNAIPQSVELWKARLRLQIMKDTQAEVDQVFKLGINALKEKALPLWSSILKYHYLVSKDDFIELIYEDAVKQSQEIANALKPQYLEWLALTRGIDRAREVYTRLAVQKPYCKDMHAMMSKLESIQIDFNFDVWGKVHKLACEQFGSEDVDVWINHIQFYLHYNKNIPDLNECVQRIRKEALNSIPTEFSYLFETKYNSVTESA